MASNEVSKSPANNIVVEGNEKSDNIYEVASTSRHKSKETILIDDTTSTVPKSEEGKTDGFPEPLGRGGDVGNKPQEDNSNKMADKVEAPKLHSKNQEIVEYPGVYVCGQCLHIKEKWLEEYMEKAQINHEQNKDTAVVAENEEEDSSEAMTNECGNSEKEDATFIYSEPLRLKGGLTL